MEYHNNVAQLLKAAHTSHENIIRAVCDELEKPEKAGELIKKLLDTSYTSVKKKKDPNAPKKPKTGYMRFCDEIREKLRKENPEMQLGGIAKLLGKEWNKLSDAKKEEYKNK